MLTLYLTPLGGGGAGDNVDPRVQSWELAMAKLRNLTGLELDIITFVFLATPTCRYRFTTDYK